MKASKLFVLGTLLLSIFMAVSAMAITFTGDVENDFHPVLFNLIIEDPGANDVIVPDHPVPNTSSGWDIKDLRLAYDIISDTLYVGINSYGIVGDADGDGDPGGNTYGTGQDLEELGESETVAVYFDLDMGDYPGFDNATSWDVIVGVGQGMDFFDFGIFNTAGSANPATNFGTPISGHDDIYPTNPSADWPDWEFSIKDFSKLQKSSDVNTDDEAPGTFRVGAYMGSQNDGDIEDDHIYYHQIPSTIVTIIPSDTSVIEGGMVELNVSEENDSTAFRGNDSPTEEVELSFYNVKVEVKKNDSDWIILMDPPGSGDNGNYMLDVGETWSWIIPSVTISEYTEFIAAGYGFFSPEFFHTFLEDPDELDETSVEVHSVNPDFTVEMTCPPSAQIGEEVCYPIIINNLGDTPLEILSVEDIFCSTFDGCVGEILSPGEECIDECCFVVPPDATDPLVNFVTVVTQVVGGPDILEEESNACETDLEEHEHCISIEKTCEPSAASVGDLITYTIKICNCDDVFDVLDIHVYDSLLGDGMLHDLSDYFPDVLAPGQCYTHTFTRIIKETDPNPLENKATVAASSEDLLIPVYASDSCYVNVGDDYEGPKAFVRLLEGVFFPLGTDINLIGHVDDSETGGFTIVSAEYSLNGGAWTSMEAKDGAFDSPEEYVTANLRQLPVGIYKISIRGTDSAGNVTEPIDIWLESRMLGVYDPDHPVAIGAGNINSPIGAFKNDPSFEGQALFGFVSDCDPSVKKAIKPKGSTEFLFQFGKSGEYVFHSSSCKKVQVYDYILETKGAKFLGEGTMNGQPGFKFMIRADDIFGKYYLPDMFAIKIWTEVAGEEHVVYDNKFGVQGGSEVIKGGICIDTPDE